MDAARCIALLRSTHFLRDSSEELLAELATRCELVELEPGQVLFEQGDPGDAFYVVDDGVLEIYVDDTVLDESIHGACLGEMALISDAVRSASIRAKEKATLVRLPRAVFRDVILRNPDLAWGLIHELAAKVRSSIRVRVERHQFAMRLEEAFARSVSRAVMDEILVSRNPVEFLQGAAKQATVLFADVHSFASLTEELEPTVLLGLLNEYLGAMLEIILEAGGTVDRCAGEGILAYFGVPLPRHKDALRAARCAMRMQEKLRQLNKNGHALPQHPLTVGIGLTTGIVVAGLVGSERRTEYTAVGDVVGLAPRVEGLTRLYGSPVLMCDETARQIGGDLLLREVDRVKLPGRGRPTHIYDVPSPSNEATPAALRLMIEYRSAFAPYASGQFTDAANRFEALSDAFPDDGPSATLAERSRKYAAQPPHNWTCIFEPPRPE